MFGRQVLIWRCRHKKHIVQGAIFVTTHYLPSDRKKKKKTEGTGQTGQLHDLLIHTDFYPVFNTNNRQ